VRIVLITGGARSGKSRYAEELARTLGGDDVAVLATAESRDDEMARRIAEHRDTRPAARRTVEERLHVGAALEAISSSVVVLDCLTVLVSNVLLSDGDAEPLDERGALARADETVERLLAAAARREGSLLVVTNEVGSGIVPEPPLARWFRDALGIANARIAAEADAGVLMASGLPVLLKGRP